MTVVVLVMSCGDEDMEVVMENTYQVVTMAVILSGSDVSVITENVT